VIRVYGAGDDNIEIEGDISEEFVYINADHGDLLAFSDGTLLRIFYDTDGIWRITPLVTGKARLVHTVCVAEGFEDDEYSDTVHLFDDGLPDDPIKWVTHGVRYEKRRR
jgi:hypothetical protein